MNVLKAILSCLLATLVLLSSMGFYVDHMVCGMSGEHQVAINKSIESCSDSCDRSSNEEAITNSCCNYNSNYFQEDLPANPTESSKRQQFSAFKYVPLAQVFESTNCAESCCFNLIDEPDILPSVERHILLQTYLI
ncbi:MAG: hypothetical protein ACI9UR_002344 [Bacteroidia bacterium]